MGNLDALRGRKENVFGSSFEQAGSSQPDVLALPSDPMQVSPPTGNENPPEVHVDTDSLDEELEHINDVAAQKPTAEENNVEEVQGQSRKMTPTRIEEVQGQLGNLFVGRRYVYR